MRQPPDYTAPPGYPVPGQPQQLPQGYYPGQAPGRPPGAAQVYQQGYDQLGAPATNPTGKLRDDPEFAGWTIVPAFYTVSIELAGSSGAVQANNTKLRPEQFILERICWATTGDTGNFFNPGENPGGMSMQGRSVEITWGDEFTRFMGSRAALISSVFGDSNGFLDIPRGIRFQGGQTLSVNLTRILWPSSAAEAVTRFDFQFQGVGLFPPGAGGYSGSAG